MPFVDAPTAHVFAQLTAPIVVAKMRVTPALVALAVVYAPTARVVRERTAETGL